LKAWIKHTQVHHIDGTLKRGQLKGSDRALGFRWPTNQSYVYRRYQKDDIRSRHTHVTEKISERCPFFFINFFFIIDPTPKLVCLALGNPSDQQHCTIAHIT
jgi:hypothetical protein